MLETELTNKGALRLYENLGFVRHKRCAFPSHAPVRLLSRPERGLCGRQAAEVLFERCGRLPTEAVVQPPGEGAVTEKQQS